MAASGYDSRQATRSSFAFAPAQPVQTRDTFNPNLRGGGVVGGDSQGSVVRGSPMTMPTGDDGIPEFLAKMVEPYVREKQAEAVVKGATDYAAGKSIKDIAKGDSGIASIFGPSGYHQGAATFAATDAVARQRADIMNDPAVEKMDHNQLGTYLAGKYRSMSTGDPITDQLVNHSIMENHGPLVTALTQKHESWVQRQALGNWSNTADSNATSLQQVMSALDPSTPASAQAGQTMTSNYLASLKPPHGMTDEVWQKGIVSHAHAALTGGNFFAFEAMKKAGLYNALTDDQQVKLDTAYKSTAADAYGKVSADPEIGARLATLDMQIRTGYSDAGHKVPMTPRLVAEAAGQINEIAQRKTGISGRDLISGNDLLAMDKQYNEGQFAAGLRLQSHQWELDAEQRSQAWDIEKEQIKQRQQLQLAATYSASGNLNGGIKTGVVKEDDANLVMGKAAADGNMGPLAHNFESGNYVNSYAASNLQSPVTNSMGVGVTAGFKGAYKSWTALHQRSPAAAVAYFGDHAANMEGYDRLLKAGETEQSAYAQTFGKGPELGRVDLPEGVKRKDAVSSVASAVAKDDKWAFGMLGSRTPLSASAASMLTNWLLPKAGAYARASGTSIDTAASNQLRAAYASGEIERAGPFVWNNQHATPKLGNYLGLPDEAVDKLVTQVAGDKLTKAGFSQGATADDYTAMRVTGADGKPALYIIGFKPDHSGHTDVLISLADLEAANRKSIGSQQANTKAVAEIAARHSILTQ